MATVRKPSKKKGKPPIDELPPDDAELIESDPMSIKAFADEAALFKALEEIGGEPGGGVVKLYREGPGGHRDITFLDEYNAGDFSIKAVQRDFGAGNYRAHVQRDGGEFVANKGFKVGPPKDGSTPRSLAGAGGITVNVPGAPGAPGDVVSMFRGLMDEQRKSFEAILSARTGGGGASQGLGVKEVIELMATINAMTAKTGGSGPANPLAMMRDVMDMVKDVKELDGSGGEGRSVSDGIFRVLEKHLPEVIGLVKDARERGGNGPAVIEQPAAPAALAAPNPAAPAAAQPQPTAEEAQAEMGFMNLLHQLTRAAQADRQHSTYVELVLDELGEVQCAQLACPPGWLGSLSTFAPALAQQKPWCDTFRAELLEELKTFATDEPSDDPVAAAEVRKLLTDFGHLQNATVTSISGAAANNVASGSPDGGTSSGTEAKPTGNS